MPYEPMVTRTGLPFWPRTSSWKVSAYLRPSWKMWPISMARSSLRPVPHLRAGVALLDDDDVEVVVDLEVTAGDDVLRVRVGPCWRR